MKLSVIFPVLNQPDLSRAAIDFAIRNLSGEEEVEVIVIDNGSDVPFFPYGTFEDKVGNVRVRTLTNQKNTGVYPTFWEVLQWAEGDVLAFLHSDLIISEKGWDKRVMSAFRENDKLGLIGFVGSDEIDSNGGRGYGTTSNFQGGEYKYNDGKGMETRVWRGSPAEAHGKRDEGYSNAAVVDGCAMIFRKSVLEAISKREDYPPHHFYDRLLSCEVREAGWEMGVLGIGCDHISGQTVNQEPAYARMAEEWATKHNLLILFHQDGITPNWDATLYREAERQWLLEYRSFKHLVPCKV